jgi:pimeloyl-ACP methyl ester carboxylesterase
MAEEYWIECEPGAVFSRAAGDADAPPIIGLHGWSKRNGAHTWEPLVDPLAEAGFRVYSVAMPGWSPTPTWERGPSAPIDVLLSIMDAVAGDRPVVLMGKSWGGGVAHAVARAHPARVRALILTAPAIKGEGAQLRVQQPVLLAWAEDDPVIPAARAAQLREAIPDLEFVLYPTGGHSAAPANAADFAPRAVDFLHRLPDSP